MTTEHITIVAMAGYRSYYGSRPGHAWDAESFPVTRRWELTAAHLLNAGALSPEQVRSYYMDGIGPWIEWDDIGSMYKARWLLATQAMERAARTLEIAA